MKIRVLAMAAAALFATAFPAAAAVPVVVVPAISPPGANEKYILRVPNERDVPATRIEIRFPRSLRVISFADVPGWTLEILRDSAKHTIGAVWTGSLAPQRFIELGFAAVNPDSAVTLVWPVFELYENGERIDWAGGSNSLRPAARTVVMNRSHSGAGLTVALWVCIGALVLSLASLVLALRSRNDSGAVPTGT